jgi:uncharacterized protein YegL
MSELIPDVSLIDNAEERVPVVLVLDCSGSMGGEPIAALQQGLAAMDADLKGDPKAARSVRVLVVQYGGDDEVEVGQWQDVMDFAPPRLVANGRTPTGSAMQRALDEIESQKEELRRNGIAYKRPLIYLMSDGVPTDDFEGASARSLAAEAANKVAIFPIAVGDDADQGILSKFSARGALHLDGLNFKELFLWLSASVKVVSQAAQGQAVQLPPTSSWASTTV